MNSTLFEAFPPVSAAQWKERLVKDLKGTGYDELSKEDRNGITVHPFYTGEDVPGTGHPLFTQPGWAICAHIRVTNEEDANKQALKELSNGASGLCFSLPGHADLATLLSDIALPYIYVQFNILDKPEVFLASWKQLLQERQLQATELDIALNYDPLAAFIQQGDGQESPGRDILLQYVADNGHLFINGLCYQNAGANSAYQLACITAHLNEYLFGLEDAGQLNQLHKVVIAQATGTDFFEEIAKLRALRILLDTLFTQYQIQPSLHFHVETSDTYRSPFDSYSNLLRDTISGMAAVTGGCHSLLIHAFEQGNKSDTDFSRRMSRNQQLIFKEESYLDLVADAAAGSFYLESLTQSLAEQAWTAFKEIEQQDGLVRSFAQVKTMIEQQAGQWIREYKEGKRILVGVNKYVDARDKPVPSTGAEKPNKGIRQVHLWKEIL